MDTYDTMIQELLNSLVRAVIDKDTTKITKTKVKILKAFRDLEQSEKNLTKECDDLLMKIGNLEAEMTYCNPRYKKEQ